MQNYLPACKIVSTHGVRGEMKALPLCDGAAFLAKFKRLFTSADGAGETRVLGVRAQGNVILLRLSAQSSSPLTASVNIPSMGVTKILRASMSIFLTNSGTAGSICSSPAPSVTV